MRRTGLVVLLSLVVVGPMHGQTEMKGQIPSDVYSRPAELLAVDGERRLNMFCMGNGSPAVILISGAWENTMPWRLVQEPASHLGRACSYDRAGLGFSDPATRPSTARATVDDLKSLLDAASIEKPVLVGHSAGGLYALLFTALYPDRVAGLVLVDPHDPEANHNTAMSGSPEIARAERRQIEATNQLLRHCVDLAREGSLTPDNTDPYCLMKEADPLLKAELDRQHVRLQTKEAVLSELISLDTVVEDDYSLDEGEFRKAIRDRNFGRLPLVLLRRGIRQKHPALPQQIFEQNEKIFLAGYERIAAYSTTGELRTVPDSGHQIQLDQREAVVAAIREVVAAARATR